MRISLRSKRDSTQSDEGWISHLFGPNDAKRMVEATKYSDWSIFVEFIELRVQAIATFDPESDQPLAKGVPFLLVESEHKKIKRRLKRFKMAPKAHKQKQTRHQGKSVLIIFFENITFKTYFVNSHTLS